jgi:uncharacterized protein
MPEEAPVTMATQSSILIAVPPYALEVGELSIPAEQECVPGMVESAIAVVVMPQHNNAGVGEFNRYGYERREMLTRRDFLKLSGGSLAGAYVVMAGAACGAGGGGQGEGGGSGEIDPDDTSPLQMTLAGASAQGFFRNLGEAIGSIVREAYPGSAIEYEPGAPAGSLAKVANGQTEIAAPTTAVEYRLAKEGTDPYEESLDGRFAGVMRFYNESATFDSVMTASYAQEYGITSLQDIADKQPPMRIAINQTGNTLVVVPATELFKAYGFTVEDIEEWGGEVLYEASGAAIELLADRQLDMYFNATLVPNSDLAEVARSVDLVWIEMDEGKLQQVAEEWTLLVSTVPAGAYDFVTEDQPSIATPHEMITSPDIPAQDIYKLVKAVYEGQEEMQSLHPGMREFSGEVMIRVTDSGVSFHPGAEEFYREQGLID